MKTSLRAALCLSALLWAGEAFAGNFCGDRIESGMPAAATEADAQAAAQTWWSSRAGAVGRGYESWAAAADKKVECEKKADGSFRCVASAKPCLPEGVLPEGMPKTAL